jgi:uncharacterized protein (TIGR00251 family)
VSSLLKVFVQPRASRNAIVGWQGDELKIALTAPPVDGAANAALIDFVAEAFQLKRRQITLHSGESSRHKVLNILSDDQNWQRQLPPKATTQPETQKSRST